MASKKPGQRLLLILMLMVPLAITFMATALVLLAGMIPAMVAMLTDRERQKLTGLTVTALNLAASMHVVTQLWGAGNTLSAATELLGNPLNWLIMYAGAALGWVLAFVVPNVVAGVITARDNARLADIRARQQQLIEEWGPEVGDLSRRG